MGAGGGVNRESLGIGKKQFKNIIESVGKSTKGVEESTGELIGGIQATPDELARITGIDVSSELKRITDDFNRSVSAVTNKYEPLLTDFSAVPKAREVAQFASNQYAKERGKLSDDAYKELSENLDLIEQTPTKVLRQLELAAASPGTNILKDEDAMDFLENRMAGILRKNSPDILANIRPSMQVNV